MDPGPSTLRPNSGVVGSLMKTLQDASRYVVSAPNKLASNDFMRVVTAVFLLFATVCCIIVLMSWTGNKKPMVWLEDMPAHLKKMLEPKKKDSSAAPPAPAPGSTPAPASGAGTASAFARNRFMSKFADSTGANSGVDTAVLDHTGASVAEQWSCGGRQSSSNDLPYEATSALETSHIDMSTSSSFKSAPTEDELLGSVNYI